VVPAFLEFLVNLVSLDYPGKSAHGYSNKKTLFGVFESKKIKNTKAYTYIYT